MRKFIGIVFLAVILPGGLVTAWVAMNYYSPGSVGTPAHAGVVTNGNPEECTNVNFSARARGYATHSVLFEEGALVRGTFNVEGGMGNVDIILRVYDPQGKQLLQTHRESNYDFTFPVPLRGDYTFNFDNRFSLYTSKSVGLFYCVEQ
jgi:hypothetical protein